MNKAYKIRLYPNNTQRHLIDKTIGCCRLVYNQSLDERIKVYEALKDDKENLYSHKYTSVKQMRERTEFLKEVPAQVLGNSLRNLDAAYKNFFRNIKNGKKTGFPKFKSRNRSTSSYTEFVSSDYKGTDKSSIRINNSKIHLLKLGLVSFRGLSKDFHGTICSCTITREKSGIYMASILTEHEQTEKKRTSDNVIGIDLGIKSFGVCSNGDVYDGIYEYLSNIDKKTEKLERIMSKRVKGSKNREKSRINLAREFEYKTNYLDKFHWALANKLCSENKVIVLEDLNVEDMMKNHRLARSISNACWYGFNTKLEQKAKEYGTEIVRVGRYFPSTQMCSKCGAVKDKENKLTLADRTYKCDCGLSIDRDLNAAVNICNSYKDIKPVNPENIQIKHWMFDGTRFYINTTTVVNTESNDHGEISHCIVK